MTNLLQEGAHLWLSCDTQYGSWTVTSAVKLTWDGGYGQCQTGGLTVSLNNDNIIVIILLT